MKYEFGVASLYHMAGAGVEHIGEERFSDYASAKSCADQEEECMPTIYIIIDDKYAFYCHYSEVFDEIPWVYSIQSTPWGQIETRIWWKELEKNPLLFIIWQWVKLGVDNNPLVCYNNIKR